MAGQTSYTFYGVVEDGFFENVVPEAFGYTAGERISGSLTLTNSLATSWTSLPQDGRFLGIATELARAEADFLFPQTAHADWTEADFVAPVSLGSTDDQRPLIDFRAALFHEFEADGPNLRFDQLVHGGAELSDDDSQLAFVSGAWVPAGVTPNLVYGTPEEDVLRPSAPLSLVWGGRGEDDIRVRSGEAFVWGGEGDDVIRGKAGADFVWGGVGDDVINGSGGADFINGQWGDDVIDGGSGDDRLWGGTGFDLIRGGAGNDIIDAGGGLDTIFGGSGNDFIISGTGNIDESFELERSVSNGGSGDDVILATFDAILTGGAGADTFAVGTFFGDIARLNGISITDFRPGVDHLSITAGEVGQFDTFDELIGAARQVGSDVVFEFSADIADLPALVLEDVRLGSLTAGDFVFGDLAL